MKLIATRKPEQNDAALDPWTAIHLSAGLALGLLNVPATWAVGATIAYEVGEQWFERRPWGQRFFATQGPESLPNAIADTFIFIVGHRLGQLWNDRY